MSEEQDLKTEYDKDLRDMVETYRAFRKLGVIGAALFGTLTVVAGLSYTIIKILKGIK